MANTWSMPEGMSHQVLIKENPTIIRDHKQETTGVGSLVATGLGGLVVGAALNANGNFFGGNCKNNSQADPQILAMQEQIRDIAQMNKADRAANETRIAMENVRTDLSEKLRCVENSVTSGICANSHNFSDVKKTLDTLTCKVKMLEKKIECSTKDIINNATNNTNVILAVINNCEAKKTEKDLQTANLTIASMQMQIAALQASKNDKS